jgi:SAM-dependent methyltransferase
MTEPVEATLRRLKEERQEADRRYNDALTALDRAQRRPPDLPASPPAYDETQLPSLNASWNILPEPPQASGLKGRLTGFIWRTVGPFLQRQLTFNSQLVDHLNRNTAAHRESRHAQAATIGALRDYVAQQADLHSHLLQLLQQITAYVDTKDRDTAGGALVLNAALSAMAEGFGKRWESMSVTAGRASERLDALAAAQDEVRAAIGVTQQAALTVKRELERLADGVSAGATAATLPPAAGDAFARLDAYKYVGFEDRFRGSREAIRSRLESYLPFFDGAGSVLDIGCGRGEFLELLSARGVSASGIDVNPEMVDTCRARGLDVVEADGVTYLSRTGDGSLGGLFGAQVVEHLEPAYLLRLLELSFHKLAPGGVLVLETLNPACWVAFFESYIRDITHVRPLHPETLKFLVMASGFPSADIVFRSPVPQQDRLQRLAVPATADAVLLDVVEAFNANVDKLNARIYTHLDYAVIGRK